MKRVDKEFNEALDRFVEGIKEIDNKHQSQFDEKHKTQVKFEVMRRGAKYIRITRNDSAHCFISKENGDVLKPASWNAPAKIARGNIFDEWNGLKLMAWTGPAYLR